MENIRRYFKRTDKTYLLLCIFSSVMAVTALSSWAAKQGNGFAVDEITGQITGLGDYRRAAVQAGAALIGLVIAVLLSNIDYRSLVKVWPVHVALTWGMVLPTLVLRNVSIGPLTIGYNAGDTDNYSWYKLGGFTLQPTELAKISFILTFAMHLNNQRAKGAGQAAAASGSAHPHHPCSGRRRHRHHLCHHWLLHDVCGGPELEVYPGGGLGGGSGYGDGVRLFQR